MKTCSSGLAICHGDHRLSLIMKCVTKEDEQLHKNPSGLISTEVSFLPYLLNINRQNEAGLSGYNFKLETG